MQTLKRIKGKNILFGIILTISFCSQLLNPSMALGTSQDLRYQGELSPVDRGEQLSSYGLVELPDEVLVQGRSGIPDLRIYAEDEEISYAILPSNLLDINSQKLRADIFNKGQDTEGNLVFEVRVPNNQWIRELQLITPNTNFVRKVKIEGSREEANWVLLQAEDTIFDLTREKKSRNTTLRFSKVNFPFLRITILKEEGKPPLRLDGAVLVLLGPQESMGELKKRPHDVSSQILKEGIQEIEIDLFHDNLPTQELTLVTEDVNFSRRVEFYESETKEKWSLLTQGELYSYQLDKASADQRSLQFKATHRYLKLKIYNQDNQPLNIQEIKVQGVNPTVIFPVEQSKKYRLYWGNEQLQKPKYDLQKLVSNLDYDKLSRFAVQNQQENPKFNPTDTRPWTERNSWLLNSVLVIVVLVLVVIIARNFSKLSR